jgi:formate dehydrogenase (NADP+) alpha subunit
MEIDWARAISEIAAGLRTRAPSETGIVLSPTSPNESLYLASKLARSVLRTPNIDFPGRHATASMRVLSSRLGEALCTIDDIDGADLIVAVGVGDGDRSPQLVPAIWRAVGRGTPVVCIDDWVSDLFSEASLSLRPKPYTDYLWIETVGHGLNEHFAAASVAEAAQGTGLATQAIEALTQKLRSASRIAFVIDTSAHGRMQDGRSVQALASLLMLLRSSKEWVGLLPIFERCNTLGALDMGAAPGEGTGLGPRVGAGPGLVEMIEAAESGGLKAMLLIGDLESWGLLGWDRVASALRRLDFLAVASGFPNGATEIAHIVLPRPLPGEVDGSYTSTEGRVQVTAPFADIAVRQEWNLFAELIGALGGEGTYRSIADVREEIAQAIPEYTRLASGDAAFLRTFWDITPVRMDQAFSPVGQPVLEPDHPFLLNVERSYLPYAKDSTLQHSPILRRDLAILPVEPHVFLGPEDAKGAAVRDGARVALRSEHGQWSARALLRNDVPSGRVVLPEVFHEDAVALLGERPCDPLTGVPLYPVVAIALSPERR